MTNANFVLEIKLNGLKNFLEHIDKEANAEIQDLCEKEDAGDFEGKGIGDFGNELFFTSMRKEITARAVYYELNALMESTLHACAHRLWLDSSKHKGPKTILDSSILYNGSIRSLKMVQDLKLVDILELIEKEYGINIDNLEEGDIFKNVREVVNSFKHRDGLIDFRKNQLEDTIHLKYHKVDGKQAYEAIDKTHIFIKALWTATAKEPI
jgi:hypothetical protein